MIGGEKAQATGQLQWMEWRWAERERETEIDREKEQEGKRVSDKCFGGDFLPGLLWPFILLLLALSSHLA